MFAKTNIEPDPVIAELMTELYDEIIKSIKQQNQGIKKTKSPERKGGVQQMHKELKSELEIINKAGHPFPEESSEMDLDPISENGNGDGSRLKNTHHRTYTE